jgi:hypothetical protein
MKEHTDNACQDLFKQLFPEGFANAEIMAIAAPDGWENSPHVRPVPPVEQAYQVAKAHHELENIMRQMRSEPPIEMESLEDFQSNYLDEPQRPEIGLQELVGACVWDIFSDNNDVVKDNQRYHIGSFRGAAGFIADWLNQTSEKQYDYMDFYMGNTARDDEDGEVDLKPIYGWLFRRLKQAGCDWVFHFTQLGLIDFSSAKDQKTDKPEDYDPNKALEEELKQKEEQKKKDEFREKIEDMNAQAREDALYKPPPQTVQAYRTVFGEFPIGWPPV